MYKLTQSTSSDDIQQFSIPNLHPSTTLISLSHINTPNMILNIPISRPTFFHFPPSVPNCHHLELYDCDTGFVFTAVHSIHNASFSPLKLLHAYPTLATIVWTRFPIWWQQKQATESTHSSKLSALPCNPFFNCLSFSTFFTIYTLNS